MTQEAMYFHHLHFYVRDVAFWRDWFIRKLSFKSELTQGNQSEVTWTANRPTEDRSTERTQLAKTMQPPTPSTTLSDRRCVNTPTADYEVLVQGAIEIRLSGGAAAADYLCHHPPGLIDVGLATDCFDVVLQRAIAQGARCIRPVSINAAGQRECQIQGWADLRHTLVEVSPQWVAAQKIYLNHSSHLSHSSATAASDWAAALAHKLCAIDHVVLNVPQDKLATASDWYQRVFGLVSTQHFEIATANSGLRSQVLRHPTGNLQIPINEPTSANSQIQEFLHHNRGAGIQHVALRSHNAVSAIAHFRQQGLDLINVPETYYESLRQRSDCPLPDTSAASRQQLLLDWAKGGQQGMLLQTFTQPIFSEPTFFFEIIERSTFIEAGQIKQAQGFGEGNFQALFEAIERAQMARGSFGCPS